METMLGRKLGLLIGIMLLLSIGGGMAVKVFGDERRSIKQEDEITIVTSFYPMYLLTKNLTEGVQGVEVINLTENQTGCLHDYRLSTKDMRLLNRADIFIMNGGGMEQFAESMLAAHSDIATINASQGMEFLEGIAHHHEEEDMEHAEEMDSHTGHENAHVWMSVTRYMEEVRTVTEGLMALDTVHQREYQNNSEDYLERLKVLEKDIAALREETEGVDIVIFHDAFAYLAESLGIKVIHSLNLDEDTALNAGEMAEVIDEVNLHYVKILWAEEGAGKTAADAVAAETGAKVLILDTLINGEKSPDAYLHAMSSNLKLLKENMVTE